MATFEDDQNHRVEINRGRQCSTIRNISAMQSTKIQICNPIFWVKEVGAKCLCIYIDWKNCLKISIEEPLED